MTKDAIVKAWKMGHSKQYLFDEHYMHIKDKPEYKKMKAAQKKLIAQHEVEVALLENYKREVG